MVLFVITGLKSGKDKEYELEYGTYIMGRSNDCDIKVNDQSISRKHAQVNYSPKGLTISDLGSANGIFVNGVKISEKNLYNGDNLSIKRVVIKVQCEFDKDNTASESKEDPTMAIEPSGDPFGGPGDPNEDSVFGLELDGKSDDNDEISRAFEIGDTAPKPDDMAPLEDSVADLGLDYQDEIGNGILDNTVAHVPKKQKTVVAEDTKMASESSSLVGGLVNALKGVLKGIENATIRPLVNMILQFEYRVLVYMFTAMGTILTLIMVLLPQNKYMEQYLVNEALTHAESIAHFLAKANRDQLIRDEYHQFDVKMALNIDNVQRARIIRRDGKIVAPVNEKYNDVKQPHLIEAVDAMRKGQVADIQKVSQYVRSVVKPIKAFTGDNLNFDSQRGSRTDNEEIIGIAQIEYSIQNIYAGDPYTAITSESLGIQLLTCLIIAIFFAFLTTKLVTPAVKNITKDLKEAQRKGKFTPKTYLKMVELDILVKTLADFVSHSGQGGTPVEADDLLGLSDGDDLSGAAHDTVEAYQCAIHVLELGVIVVDADQTIVIANDSFARQMQYGDKSSVEGQPLSSIINDIDTTEKIAGLIDNVNSSSETIITDSIEMSGYDNQISICKSESGNFYALLFKESNF